MRYELVNVSDVRDEKFTAELIVAPDGDSDMAVVGTFEDNENGNLVAGVSLYNVHADQIEYTGQTIDREVGQIGGFTPNLV